MFDIIEQGGIDERDFIISGISMCLALEHIRPSVCKHLVLIRTYSKTFGFSTTYLTVSDANESSYALSLTPRPSWQHDIHS
jgi:hypothetical protein